MPSPHAIVLRAPGTNCDEEAAYALGLAGAVAETWHINQVIESPAALDRFQILVIPGGFSYGDDLGAGRILATRIATTLGEALRRFHERGGLVLGICNGFQVLVRSGLLPGGPAASTTLAANESGRFEDRWVKLLPRVGLSPFVTFSEPIELPVAHGEGRFLMSDSAAVAELEAQRSGRAAIQRPRFPSDPGLSGQSQRVRSCHRRRVRPHRANLRSDAAPRAIRRALAPPQVDTPAERLASSRRRSAHLRKAQSEPSERADEQLGSSPHESLIVHRRPPSVAPPRRDSASLRTLEAA